MTQITQDHVEWLVVNRLQHMLEEPPHQAFNVTQTYSFFTATLCWLMQRIRIPTHKFRPEDDVRGKDDRTVHSLLNKLNNTLASEEPWSLPVSPAERITTVEKHRIVVPVTKTLKGARSVRRL
jgi:hypothetical protein